MAFKGIKIGLWGYGRMGKAVEEIAIAEGDIVVWRVDQSNAATMSESKIREADVVIEFSTPDVAFENISKCLKAGVNIVSGTTGWLRRRDEIDKLALQYNRAFLHANNFSIGVNLFFAIHRIATSILIKSGGYRPELEETHHLQKLDAPSGTAIKLAEILIEESKGLYNNWVLDHQDSREDSINISALREPDVPGTHQIQWVGDIDEISLTHRAFNRKGFAHGALLAARWIRHKSGIYSMEDVLELKNSKLTTG